MRIVDADCGIGHEGHWYRNPHSALRTGVGPEGRGMSQDVLVTLARQVAGDLSAQPRIEAMSDEELAAVGLEPEEIRSIRTGFFDRVLRAGLAFGDDAPGCCTG